MKPVISRYPVNWKHESTVEVKWKADEMTFPLNLPVNVDLYYPKVGDLLELLFCCFVAADFYFFILFIFLLIFFHQYCLSYSIRNSVLYMYESL